MSCGNFETDSANPQSSPVKINLVRKTGVSSKDLRPKPLFTPSRLQERKNRLGLGKLSSGCLSDFKSVVSCYESKDEADEAVLEENKNRCDFFKHYKYDRNDRLGSVSIITQ